MFEKILIANRGEIACRVIKTAKIMGIKTVAVYSAVDKQALHVRMADEAVYIGPAPAAESYLNINNIIAACKSTGAQAVHPGYGFLSERAAFAQRLKAENITFIGPPTGAIEAMGDKITSKQLASDAGVSTVPGHMGLINDADHAVKIATEIGYPVMIKASAGGGGKGMRVAFDDAEAREGFDRSKSEAASSFGDDRIFIEKFIEQPRHIEIQVLADTHGNCIYLGERECSIQRRNQKVIEEAPSPFLDEATRKAMGEQSVALSQAVDYASAGTVEFIVDKDKHFYFLEMNTRLQVEHPVTELITSIDLVEQMIRVAWGEQLTLSQSDISLNGWAMESRLYAEDPYRNFMPSTGRLKRYVPPPEKQLEDGCIVRNDTGVYEGGEISIYYDPMIAKLCTWGSTREKSIAAMQNALNEFTLEGIGHNLPFLSAVMAHERFQKGDQTTAFIDDEWPNGFDGTQASDADLVQFAFAAATLDYITSNINSVSNAEQIRISDAPEKYVRMNGKNTKISCVHDDHAQAGGPVFIVVTLDEKTTAPVTTKWQAGDPHLKLKIGNDVVSFQINPVPGGYRLRHKGIDLNVQVLPERTAKLASLMPVKLPRDTSKTLLCPMPGLVVELMVKDGDLVEEGQPLAVVEAMKMENVLRAEKAGEVKNVRVSQGDNLAVDAIMMEFV